MRLLLFAMLTGLAAVTAGIGFTYRGVQNAVAAESATSHMATNLAPQGSMPSLAGAETWFNSAPLTPAQLRGKVVLVDFWTYSCINCIRTIPHIRAWAKKYRDNGLVVLGVHTPEFQFEHDLTNIHAAMERFRIDFPVAVDSKYRIWEAFGNRAWPAVYLVDGMGNIRYRQFGEGNYERTEWAIQALLREAGEDKFDAALVRPVATDEQMAPDADQIRSGETYVGYGQATNLRSLEGVKRDTVQNYSIGKLALTDWGLIGRWSVHEDRARASQSGSGIAYRFSARDLHLVAGPGMSGKPIRIRVTVDGHAPGANHGADIDSQGYGVITQTRLYQLVRQVGRAKEMQFEIQFLEPGAEAYAFTFG